MANIRHDQSADGTPISTDKFPYVYDPATTHVSKSSTFAHLADLMASLLPARGIIGATSPTLNYVSKFTPGTENVGNSLLFDNGTNIGLGHASPTARLDIKGLAVNDLPTYSAEFLDAANWTLGAGWSGDFAAGFTHAAGTATLAHDHAAVSGTKYQITVTISGYSAGSVSITLGGQTVAGFVASGITSLKASSTGVFTVTPTSDFIGTIIVAVKSITSSSTPTLIFRDSGGSIKLEARISGGDQSLFLGRYSGAAHTIGTGNSGFGFGVLQNIMTGTQNSGFGSNALNAAINTIYNSAFGSNSLMKCVGGTRNAGFGNDTFYDLTEGYRNAALGYGAGYKLTIGYGNIFIGSGAGNNASQKVDAINTIAIGYNTYTTADNQVVIGNDSITSTILKGDVSILAKNLVTDTTTGMKIGTATNQKIGFFNKTPIVQQAHIADATGAADVITRCNAILAVLENFGFLATA